MKRKGIDLSTFQKNVDWQKVKKDGIEFAILRAGFGKAASQKDKLFEQHYRGAKAVGIPVGAYHYSYAMSVAEAKQEAEVFLSWLLGKELEYPVWFDIEDPTMQKLGKELLTEITIAFCERVKAAGYRVGVYASKHWFSNLLDFERLKQYPIWLAQYNEAPTFSGNYDIWQYTSSGKVDGIAGNVDLNWCYTDFSEKASEQKAGWIEQNGRWWYRHTDGSYPRNGWEKIENQWYYFDGEGWMKTGWILIGGNWYYCDASGKMQTGWISYENNWYYCRTDGVMLTGTVTIDGKAYHFAEQTGNGYKIGQMIVTNKDGVLQ